MLDVHAPEHPIHGIRDFFMHLFTITVGLLIALGLENAAEWGHHVHIAHEAEANIRREIAANQQDLRAATAAVPGEQANLQRILDFLQARIDGKPTPSHSLTTGFTAATLQDASWNTATATGALSFIDYSEVERFSSAYQIQRKLDQTQDSTLPSIVGVMASIGTGDPTTMSPAEAATTMHNVRLTMAYLATLQSLAGNLDSLYNEARKP